MTVWTAAEEHSATARTVSARMLRLIVKAVLGFRDSANVYQKSYRKEIATF